MFFLLTAILRDIGRVSQGVYYQPTSIIIAFVVITPIVIIADYIVYKRTRKKNPTKLEKQNALIELAIVNTISSIAIMLVAMFIPVIGSIILLLLARRFNQPVKKLAIFFGVFFLIIYLPVVAVLIFASLRTL